MENRIKLVAAIFIGLMNAATGAVSSGSEEASIKVNITGQVKNTSCTAVIKNSLGTLLEAPELELAEVEIAEFGETPGSYPRGKGASFNLGLKNCLPEKTAATVTLVRSGIDEGIASDADNKGILLPNMLNSELQGGAKGVAIRIATQDQNADVVTRNLKLIKRTQSGTVAPEKKVGEGADKAEAAVSSSSDAELTYIINYESTVPRDQIQPGRVRSTANFFITHQ